MMRKAETTTRKTIRCSPISSKSDRDDARGGNAPAAGVPPANLRRYLVYIAYSRFGARAAERDDKRNGVTDRLSDYYRKFSSLTARSSKAPPIPAGLATPMRRHPDNGCLFRYQPRSANRFFHQG